MSDIKILKIKLEFLFMSVINPFFFFFWKYEKYLLKILFR